MRRLVSIIIVLLLIVANVAAQEQDSATTENNGRFVFPDSLVVVLDSSHVVAADSISSAEDNVLTAPKLDDLFSFGKIIWIILFLIGGHYTIAFLVKTIELWSERSSERRLRGKAIVPVIRIIGWLALFYIITFAIVDPPFESLVALGASAGVALGFASQDILKNIFGGFVILIDKPFKVGDKIEVGSIYGEVIDMSLRSTRIVTPDDSIVSLPNGDLMNQAVSNSNAGETNCQVVAEIYLPIDIDTDQVRRIATEAAKICKYIYLAKPIAVIFLNELDRGGFYYKMRLKAYVMDIRYEFAFKSEMTEKTIKALRQAGVYHKNKKDGGDND